MGPKNTLYFIESCRYFLQRYTSLSWSKFYSFYNYRRDLNLRIREFESKSSVESNDIYQDDNMKVIPIVIKALSDDSTTNANNQMQLDETNMNEQMDIDASQTEFQNQITLYSKIDYDEKSKFHHVKLHKQGKKKKS